MSLHDREANTRDFPSGNMEGFTPIFISADGDGISADGMESEALGWTSTTKRLLLSL